MDREAYRRAFDSLPFSPDFQDRTEALLLEWVNRQEQEEATMNRKFFRRPAVLAAVIAVLMISVSAAVVLLNPSQVAEEVKAGRNYVIFAEGTRSRRGNELLPFKGGTFKSAVKARCPIVPVALIDSYRPFDERGIARQEVQVHFLPPLYPDQYIDMKTNQIADLVHDQIQEKINQNIP